MSDTDQNVNEDGESENKEHSEDLDYDSLTDSVESNDSKVILSVLQNQNEKIKDMSFGINYLKMKMKAVNSRVKTNEDKILVLEQENSRKDSEIAKLKTEISRLQKANKRTVSENDGIKQSLEHQDMYMKRKISFLQALSSLKTIILRIRQRGLTQS